MTLNKLVPWGRKNVPIKRNDELSPPTIWSDFGGSFSDMDRLFERFFSLAEQPFSHAFENQFMPSLDVHETEKEFQITVEVPGMDEKNIDISISRDMLTISGEKKEEKEENAKGIYRLERQYGAFSRSIPLPQNCVDTEKAEASYKGGVLTIKLPKTPDYKESVKKIPVLKNISNSESSGDKADQK